MYNTNSSTLSVMLSSEMDEVEVRCICNRTEEIRSEWEPHFEDEVDVRTAETVRLGDVIIPEGTSLFSLTQYLDRPIGEILDETQF